MGLLLHSATQSVAVLSTFVGRVFGSVGIGWIGLGRGFNSRIVSTDLNCVLLSYR